VSTAIELEGPVLQTGGNRTIPRGRGGIPWLSVRPSSPALNPKDMERRMAKWLPLGAGIAMAGATTTADRRPGLSDQVIRSASTCAGGSASDVVARIMLDRNVEET